MHLISLETLVEDRRSKNSQVTSEQYFIYIHDENKFTDNRHAANATGPTDRSVNCPMKRYILVGYEKVTLQ
jgi:hypothetical protein